MARPRVFVSSTFYDLKQVRADLEIFIKECGYEAVLNERGSIPYGNSETLEEYCYREISNCDLIVSIIGGRFGAQSSLGEHSISQTELKTASRLNKQIFIFVEHSVNAEYRTYLKNKNKEIEYASVDNVKVYAFLEEIHALPRNNPIAPFESSQDIVGYLRQQWSGMFHRYLNDQVQFNQLQLIGEMKSSIDTLSQLVKFLAEANQNGQNAIKTIVTTNHPIFPALKKLLRGRYRLFFVNLSELNDWLSAARAFKPVDDTAFDSPEYLEWISDKKGKNQQILYIYRDLFDSDGFLREMSAENWNEKWVRVAEYVDPNKDDEIPF